MNIGLVLDMRNPPDRRVPWSRVYGHALELCEEADRLGGHSVWFTEHHGFDDGYNGQPMAFAAAVAARTRRIRIGTAVVIAPMRPAADIAEQSVLVDAISNGRFELGLGAGYRLPEYELWRSELGIGDWENRYKVTVDRVRAIRRMWEDGTILPAPTQDRIPIWLGFGGPVGAKRAGRLGEKLMTVRRDLLPPYLEGLTESGHDRSVAAMGGFMRVFVTDDPERDWPVVSKCISYMYDSYGRHAVEGTGRPAPPPIDIEKWREQGIGAGSGAAAHEPAETLVFTTPENAAAQLRDFFTDVPIETLVVWVSPGILPEEMAMRHMELLVTELAPRLAGA